jgi:hypothetical protein
MEQYYSVAANQHPGFSEEQVEQVIIHPEDTMVADGVPFRVLTKERGDQSGLWGQSWVVRTPEGYKMDWLKTKDLSMQSVKGGLPSRAIRDGKPKKSEVIIDSVQKMIAFDEENPADYLGATLRVEPSVGWIDPIAMKREASVKGFLLRWKCGENYESSQDFGAGVIRQAALNYVIDTERGLRILDGLKKGTHHRKGMTFVIEAQVVNGRQIIIARLKTLEPGKNSALDRARGQAVIDEILRN